MPPKTRASKSQNLSTEPPQQVPLPPQNSSTAPTQHAPAPSTLENDSDCVQVNYYFSIPTQRNQNNYIENNYRKAIIPCQLFEDDLQTCRDFFVVQLSEEFSYQANPKHLVFQKASHIPVVWIPDVLILCSLTKISALVTPLGIQLHYPRFPFPFHSPT